MLFFFFFFQAEDGIRDVAVTGVQTCALPISCVMQSSNGSAWPNCLPREWSANKVWTRRRPLWRPWRQDRKSTRLNSSHGYISYAVFCLKKKNFNLPGKSFRTKRGFFSGGSRE